MRGTVELPDIHDVTFVLKDGSFVVVDIKIVGGGEDGHNGWKPSCFRLSIHAISETTVRSR